MHAYVRPAVRPSVPPSVHPSRPVPSGPSVRLSVRPPVRSSVRPSSCPSDLPSIHLSIHPSIRPSFPSRSVPSRSDPSVRPSAHTCMRAYIFCYFSKLILVIFMFIFVNSQVPGHAHQGNVPNFCFFVDSESLKVPSR